MFKTLNPDMLVVVISALSILCIGLTNLKPIIDLLKSIVDCVKSVIELKKSRQGKQEEKNDIVPVETSLEEGKGNQNIEVANYYYNNVYNVYVFLGDDEQNNL